MTRGPHISTATPATRARCISLCALMLLAPVSTINRRWHRDPIRRPTPASIIADESGRRQLVAEGEYRLRNGAHTAFMGAAFDFMESWILWRLSDGDFEVNGRRSYRTILNGLHDGEFFVHLSSDFRVSRMKYYSRLRWRADSGPLSCELTAHHVVCSSNAKVKGQEVRVDAAMCCPTAPIWPISLFSLSGITRATTRDIEISTPIQLLKVEELSKAEPVVSMILRGQLKYLGQEYVSVAGSESRADKFELQTPSYPPFLLWVSSSGLLLAFGPENPPKTVPEKTLVLMKFRQWEKF